MADFPNKEVAQVYNLSIWELGAGGSKVQGHPQLCSKFEDSIGCIKANVEEKANKGSIRHSRQQGCTVGWVGLGPGSVDAAPCVFISPRNPQYWRARKMSCGCCEVLEEGQGGCLHSEQHWTRKAVVQN